MTTIAYRAGVLAADTQCTAGQSIKMATGCPRKVVKLGDGTLIGAAGPAGWCDWFLGWRADSADLKAGFREPPDSFVGVEISPKGEVFEWSKLGRHRGASSPYDAWGSGAELALGAMYAGGGACDGVRAAIAHDCFSGGEVTFVTLGAAEVRQLQAFAPAGR